MRGTDRDRPNRHDVATALLRAVLIMLTPLLVAHLLGSTASLAVTIPAGFLVVVAILTRLHMRHGNKVKPTILLIALWLAGVQTIPLWWGSVVGNTLMLGDLVNVAAKPIVFLLLVGLFVDTHFSARELTYLTHRFTLVVLGVAAYGFVAGLSAIAGIRLGMSSYSVDYSSFLANRNQFGMLLFLGLASLLLTRAVRGPKRYDYWAGLALLVSVTFTMSRGSLLGVALLLGITLAIRKTSTFVVFIAPSLLISALLMYFHPIVRSYVTQFFVRPDVGLSGRDEIWAVGLDLATERPIQGWGSFFGVAEAQSRGMDFGQFHSFWLEQLVDWGVIGLVSVLALFVVTWTKAYRSAPSRVRHVLLAVGAGAAAMGTFESINILSVGYVDTLWTMSLLTIPVLLSRSAWHPNELVAEDAGDLPKGVSP